MRKHLATLKAEDFAHGVTTKFAVKEDAGDAEAKYRTFLLSLLNQPLVGSKRGAPAINVPPERFLLSSIETPDAILVPFVWPETLMPLVQWNQPGNPYYDNRGLKHRAYVTAVVRMTMLDEYLETTPELGGARTDLLAYHLVTNAAPYPGFQSILPQDVQRAYEAGLRRLAQRIFDWGLTGDQPNTDLIAPVGLWYVARALRDPAFSKQVEDFSRPLFVDPSRFHPAGYFVDRGGVDLGYQGMSNFFASWAALATEQPFAREAVARTYRLRAHMILPEPDGAFTGPTHFNTRLSSSTHRDQWEWGIARDAFASLVTDEAAHLVTLPSQAALDSAAARQASAFGGQIAENPRGAMGFIKNEQIVNHPWTWRQWPSWNFPGSVNYGYEFYPQGAYARRSQLEAERSPLLQSPFRREENFVRDFDGAFVVAKQPTFAAIVHTGPVGAPEPQSGLRPYVGPLGFGGGQLSAFWTPTGGSILLGRRGGTTTMVDHDPIELWQQWPLHAVTGVTHDGKVFTSARILRPDVSTKTRGEQTVIDVRGIVPREQFDQGKTLEGRLAYARVFTLRPDSVHVQTTLRGHGQDKLAELYETLPVFLYEGPSQQAKAAVTIEFQSNGQWQAATAEPTENVAAIRIRRFDGGATIEFDQPQRVRLAPEAWTDTYLSKASCRNVLIDLLQKPGASEVFRGERTVGYAIRPSGR